MTMDAVEKISAVIREVSQPTDSKKAEGVVSLLGIEIFLG